MVTLRTDCSHVFKYALISLFIVPQLSQGQGNYPRKVDTVRKGNTREGEVACRKNVGKVTRGRRAGRREGGASRVSTGDGVGWRKARRGREFA